MRRVSLSAYRAMWLMAMFDLPVETKENRRHYTRFRKLLMKDGFMMLQYSVYARYIPARKRPKPTAERSGWRCRRWERCA